MAERLADGPTSEEPTLVAGENKAISSRETSHRLVAYLLLAEMSGRAPRAPGSGRKSRNQKMMRLARQKPAWASRGNIAREIISAYYINSHARALVEAMRNLSSTGRG